MLQGKLGEDIVEGNELQQPEKKKRRQVQKITDKMAKALIALFNHPKKYSNGQIGMKVDLSTRAVYRARCQYYETGNIQPTNDKRRSQALFKKHQKIIMIASQELIKNPYHTMTTLSRILQKNEIYVSSTTVSRVLKKQKFSYKKLTYIPYSRNTQAVIQKRFQYCREIKQLNDQNLYFTDETSFNLKTALNYGWAKIGQEASIKIADSAGETISVLAIINIKGLVSFSIIKGTAKTENIENNFKNNALPLVKDKDVLIMDNVKSHRSEEIMGFIRDTGLQCKYLPPYSPQLNPIENLFGVIKARFRRLRVQRELKTTSQLICTVKEVFEQHYGVDLRNYYRKMREYVELGLQNIAFEHHI